MLTEAEAAQTIQSLANKTIYVAKQMYNRNQLAPS